jgi:zinc resistance-associated protein
MMVPIWVNPWSVQRRFSAKAVIGYWRTAMWKPILAGTAALAILGTSLVYAQQRDDGSPRWRGHDADRRVNLELSQEDRAAFTDARIAALKAGLRLTPDQEKNWPAFETALRDLAKMHGERYAGKRRDEPGAGDRSADADRRGDAGSVERLRHHAEMMIKAAESLQRLANAQEPLYQSLDDSQKNRFQILSRVIRHSYVAQMRGHGGHHMMHGHHGMGDDHGMMRGDRGMMRRDRDGDDRRGPRGMRGGDRGRGGGMMEGMGEQL